MILPIDCFKLVKGTGKSIGIYNLAKNLVDNLDRLDSSTRIVVFGNKYNREDFGFPPLEAMKLDVPVYVLTELPFVKPLVMQGYENIQENSWENRIECYRKVLVE